MTMHSESRTEQDLAHVTPMYTPPHTLAALWLIAKRQAVEALFARSTLVTFSVSLVVNTFVVLSTLQSATGNHAGRGQASLGASLSFLLLLVALINAQPAIGIAAGVFAGDKERGSLLPLLAAPTSNVALFAGKIVGAALPALLYTIVGIIVYLLELIVIYGQDTLHLLFTPLSGLVVLFIPVLIVFASLVAALISSRVRTFQSAQTYSSLITTGLWLIFGALVFVASLFSLWIFAFAVVVAYALDVLLIVLAARTWRREEVVANT